MKDGKKGSEARKELVELYRIYHDSIENVAKKRQSANSFFLTFCTSIVGLLGLTTASTVMHGQRLIPLLTMALGAVSSFFWFRLIESYRQLNTGKFAVLISMEETLGIELYKKEWEFLGAGKDTKKYHPLTRVERIVPCVFLTIFVCLAVLNVVQWIFPSLGSTTL